jgi:hypothetical protein
MSREVPDVLAQIALIQKEIVNPLGGQVNSYTDAPYTISTMDMPLFINYVGNLVSNELRGSDEMGREFLETRNYSMNLFLAPYASGIEGEKISQLTPYFPLVYKLFGSYPHLNSLGNVTKSQLVSDSGVLPNLKFSGQEYFGVRFTLQVQTLVRRALSEND